ncbi:pathogen-related protein [Phtheirospermum japonicum]|uniref:Pathogen-related protein n=1 Tax=Phtheirospermum japonicum TaxID=374723 RepID=A0A830CPL0_9LAMI|nr:pathogen-related protein [Phtheirospermum japonicum]
MATSNVGGDKYRSYLTPQELQTTQWIAGPPNYDVVNKLFEEGRTKVWPAESLEEYVQNLIKTWEMELVHKANPDDYKTLDPKNFTIGINALRLYNPDEETYETSQSAFKQVFPRGFALEILQVFSGPPLIAYKFRHWGFFEGAYKDHAPTGELVEIFGTSIVEMNEENKIVKVEFFFDRGELLAALIKGKTSDDSTAGCPFMA